MSDTGHLVMTCERPEPQSPRNLLEEVHPCSYPFQMLLQQDLFEKSCQLIVGLVLFLNVLYPSVLTGG